MIPSFNELKKAAKQSGEGMKTIRFAVVGDCATQHVSTALRGFAHTVGYHFDLFDADYNQLDAQTMDPGSELYAHAPAFTLLYNCTEKLYESYASLPMEERGGFADRIYAVIAGRWERISSVISTRILQTNFPEEDDGVFGSYAFKVPGAFINQVRKLNVLLSEGAQSHKNVFIADAAGLRNELGREGFSDPGLYYLAKLPMKTDALPYFAKAVLETVSAAEGKFHKCAVLDLDNTLWGGVIGDDGLEGIAIGELGTGHAFTDLQRWLKELRERGVILAVCSKNNEDTAKEPFEKHPEMVLRLSDISMFVANWEDKATNIRRIQSTLNIGMDSMVFLDDNPFERNLVRSMIPEITVPELPEDPAEYLSYLRSLNLFETASYSGEDRERTAQYQAEIGRAALMDQFADFDDYLKSLEMVAKAAPFDKFSYPRVSQLTQRSNQFNLRTVRYTEAEIEEIAESDRYLTIYFTLRDKFGDHGLISVVILEKRENKTLFIHEWLMSCRVLKRGMEEFIINTILSTAAENGFETVIGEYLKTPKNAMVKDIYSRLGFTLTGEDGENRTYTASVSSFTPNKTLIAADRR